MNIEDIKAGETYYIRVKPVDVCNEEGYINVRDMEWDIACFKAKDVYPVAAPKYDPCRKFRKGDIVRLREYNGRKPYDFLHKQVIKNYGAELDTVLEDELDSGNVDIFQDAPIDELTVRVHSCHLELVTPIEELAPYYVSTNIDCSTCTIFKRVGEKKLVHSAYYFVHGKGCSNAILGITEAEAAAETECARLNDEWRKEKK